MLKHVHKVSGAVALLSSISHIFCCGLPLVATLFSLGAATGALTSQTAFEAFFHDYEAWIMGGAAFMLVLGGAAQYVSWKLDCTKEGCFHSPCEPKKKMAFKIYLVSCAIFVLSLGVLFLVPHIH